MLELKKKKCNFSPRQQVVERNLALTSQFTRYLLEHPGLFATLPDQLVA